MFEECDTCTRKPGTPVLCRGCVKNRETIRALGFKVSRLEERIEKLQRYACQCKWGSYNEACPSHRKDAV